MGYCSTSKGYKCLDLSTNKMHISRHVTFLECEFPFSKVSQPSITLSPSSRDVFYSTPGSSLQFTSSTNSQSSPSHGISPTVSTPYHQHTMTPPSRTSLHSSTLQTTSISVSSSSSFIPPPPPRHPMIARSQVGIYKPRVSLSPLSLTAITGSTLEPQNFASASKSPNWIQATHDEYHALINQTTWSLVAPPPNSNIIDCK